MPKPLPEGLTVVQLRNTDIVSLAELLSTSLDDGSLYQFPDRLKHADSVANMYIGAARRWARQRNQILRVAVIPDGGRSKVVGFSMWRHMAQEEGTDKTTRVDMWNASWLDLLEDALEYMGDKYTSLYTSLHPQTPNPGLIPNNTNSTAIAAARNLTPCATKTDPCLILGALATHRSYYGMGIASHLVRWGMDEAARLGLPVHVGGEEQGAIFYERALGFRRLPKSEYWLDKDGKAVSREEVERGSVAWKTENGGVSGCDLVWCPDGVEVDMDGFLVKC